MFIPKPGRDAYSGPRDYRPIILISFLLKTMERLLDRYLRDEILAPMLLYSNQYAYQAGKSVESALNELSDQGHPGGPRGSCDPQCDFLRFEISRGCPQGGVLSPLLWCLVVDDLVTRLSGSGIFV